MMYSVHLFLSLNVVVILANSADPDEMQHLIAAFHLGLHCLPKYPLYKGLINIVFAKTIFSYRMLSHTPMLIPAF